MSSVCLMLWTPPGGIWTKLSEISIQSDMSWTEGFYFMDKQWLQFQWKWRITKSSYILRKAMRCESARIETNSYCSPVREKYELFSVHVCFILYILYILYNTHTRTRTRTRTRTHTHTHTQMILTQIMRTQIWACAHKHTCTHRYYVLQLHIYRDTLYDRQVR